MPSISSAFQAAEIESTAARGVAGAVSGGVGVVLAVSAADAFLVQVAIIGLTTLTLMLVLGVGYNAFAEG